MRKARGHDDNFPTPESLRWVYFCDGCSFPELKAGTRVLVDFYGRSRVAVVGTRIPGGMYWGQLCAPVGGSTRVIVSKNSLQAVEHGSL